MAKNSIIIQADTTAPVPAINLPKLNYDQLNTDTSFVVLVTGNNLPVNNVVINCAGGDIARIEGGGTPLTTVTLNQPTNQALTIEFTPIEVGVWNAGNIGTVSGGSLPTGLSYNSGAQGGDGELDVSGNNTPVKGHVVTQDVQLRNSGSLAFKTTVKSAGVIADTIFETPPTQGNNGDILQTNGTGGHNYTKPQNQFIGGGALPSFADNASAVLGGLVAGQLYVSTGGNPAYPQGILLQVF